LNSYQRSFLKKCQIKVKKAKWSKLVGERGGERRWGEKVGERSWGREVGGEKVGERRWGREGGGEKLGREGGVTPSNPDQHFH
jgi:hypothetical protein